MNIKDILKWLFSDNRSLLLLGLQIIIALNEFIFSIYFTYFLTSFYHSSHYEYLLKPIYFFPGILVYIILSISLTFYSNKISFNIIIHYVDKLMSNFFNQYNNLVTKEKSFISNLFSGETYRLVDKIYMPVFFILSKSIIIILISSYLMIYFTKLFIFTSLFFILFGLLFSKTFSKRLKFYGNKITENNSQRHDLISELWGNNLNIKLFNLSNLFSNRVYANSVSTVKSRSVLNTLNSTPRILIESLFVVFLFSVFNYYEKNRISELIIFFLLLIRMLPYLNSFYYYILEIKSNINILDHFNALEKEMDSNKLFKYTTTNKSEISLKNIKLQFKNKQLSYDNINIELGKHYCVIGESGKGKTTLLLILAACLKPTSGEFGVLNINFNQNVSLCLQNSSIFNSSILSNIVCGFELDRNRLSLIYHICELDDICNLEEIGNTYILNNGNNLSGGQIQRLSIARSLYKNCDFYFFDESTSSISEDQQNRIIEKLLEFLQDKTVVMVAHRKSLIDKFKNYISL
jgi:ABC-type bacteriocin/lantibiotic exporter with double-glycine peptidase domain